MKQMEEIEFSLHPICVVGEIKSGRAPIKSEHKNLEHSQTSHKQVTSQDPKKVKTGIVAINQHPTLILS